MISTFARNIPTPREPRNQLNEGVTQYYIYRVFRPQSKPPVVSTFEVPESAKDFAAQFLEFPFDAPQQEALATTGNRVIICCTRQWGKSTTGAAKIIHHALFHPGSLILIASRSRRQACELLEKAIDFATALDLPIRRARRHPDSLLLPNGSRIIALPGKPDNLRCFSAVSLLVIDEAAYVPDALYHALRPMLATTDGAIWLLSTPCGRSGFFYEEWSKPGDLWAKFMVTAADCPRISEKFLDEERILHGPAVFRREYFCDFSYSGQSYFDLDALDDVSGPERYHTAASFAAGRPTDRFYVGLDVGQKVSHSAIVVIERVSGTTGRYNPVTFELIKEMHLIIRRVERLPLGTPYEKVIAHVCQVVRELGDIRNTTVVPDATGCGQVFLENLQREHQGFLLQAVAITSGGRVSMSGNVELVPKRDLVYNANYTLNTRLLSGEPGMAGLKQLREEMEAYRIRTSRGGTDSFRTAQKDDLVMAFALAVWKVRHYLPKASELG